MQGLQSRSECRRSGSPMLAEVSGGNRLLISLPHLSVSSWGSRDWAVSAGLGMCWPVLGGSIGPQSSPKPSGMWKSLLSDKVCLSYPGAVAHEPLAPECRHGDEGRLPEAP